MHDYASKSAAYFAHARQEIRPLLPGRVQRVLELGCGSGETLGWMRSIFPEAHTAGLELSPAAAAAARRHAHEVWCGDVERDAWGAGWAPFDVVLCLDVLEHLVDPWRMVDRLVTQHLAPGGSLIVSLPNVRHYSVLAPLVFGGRWDYTEAGLLDRTHLRFFTRRSAEALISHPNLQVCQYRWLGFEGKPLKRSLNWLTLGLFREFVTYQHWLVAQKTASADVGV